jgi:tRNA1(Val) A37 N6-methylase TrmN6
MNKKCQVFTPADYVEELLDSVGYTENLYGKKILENSCGDGNILVAVVQRYIDDCNRQELTKEQIRKGLSSDICGIEIDKEQFEKCIYNLNGVLRKNKIQSVKWNINNNDYFELEDIGKYNFIVGNPPYITYKEMKKEQQISLKKNFESCKKGKFDYCYAFIEKSINCLVEHGKMSYLIPGSIFKTVFGENLRNYIKPYITEIHDFTQVKMFDNALVKSAIMVLSNEVDNNNLHYVDVAAGIEINIDKENLDGKWFFSNDAVPGTRRFGDYFRVSHVVATLLNEAYVLKEGNYIETADYYLVNGVNIEKAIVRETATPKSKRYNKIEKIIFPYEFAEGKLVKYSENEFYKKYPGAFQYLNGFREQLDERESDKNAKWFEYGRSQALAGLNHRKLLISTVITDRVRTYPLKKKCIPYSGMYIVTKKRGQLYKLDDAKEFLESDEFMEYVKKVGIHISGSSLRITSKDIEEYRF